MSITSLKVIHRAALLLGLGLAPACGVLDDKPKSVGDFCLEYAKRECGPTAAICSRNAAECEPIRRAACMAFVAPFQDGAGRVFRSNNAEDCLERVEETYKKSLITAADLAALRGTCSRVVEGAGVANASCGADQDCRSPLVCDKGRCGPQRVVGAGANCANPGEVCQPTEYCKTADGLSVCSARGDKNAACSATSPCKPTFRCNAAACADKAAANAPCKTDDECATGYCNPYPPATVGNTCLPGLSFSPFSPSCEAYFGASPAPDGGA